MATLQHFKITGTEHASSARRTIELDAPNRAAAEKRARLDGIDEILRVEQVAEDATPRAPRVTHRGEFDEGPGNAKWILAVAGLALVIAAAIIIWLRTRA
jgi:hypothetical protein